MHPGKESTRVDLHDYKDRGTVYCLSRKIGVEHGPTSLQRAPHVRIIYSPLQGVPSRGDFNWSILQSIGWRSGGGKVDTSGGLT